MTPRASHRREGRNQPDMAEILAIGSHVTECLRIARMIDRYGELFIQRVYTAEEIRYCQSRKQATPHFAALWAAKEATLRALGTTWRRGISWHDMEIRVADDGATSLVLDGGAKRLAEARGVARLLLALAHCRTHATATVIALGRAGAAES